MRNTLLAAITAATLFSASMSAQEVVLGPADGRDLPGTDIGRVAVGTAAPDFTLGRFGGGTLRLSSFRSSRNVVLVFFRGYWCPYCITQLSELRTLLDAELQRNTELIVVSIDGENETRQTITRISREGAAPDFTFLTDVGSAVISRYGILNPSGSRRGIPHPATYVIDKGGVVRWVSVETDYRIRPSNEDILRALKALPAGGE